MVLKCCYTIHYPLKIVQFDRCTASRIFHPHYIGQMNFNPRASCRFIFCNTFQYLWWDKTKKFWVCNADGTSKNVLTFWHFKRYFSKHFTCVEVCGGCACFFFFIICVPIPVWTFPPVKKYALLQCIDLCVVEGLENDMDMPETWHTTTCI